MGQRIVPSLLWATVALIATPFVLGFVFVIAFFVLAAFGVPFSEDDLWFQLIALAPLYLPVLVALLTLILGLLGKLPGTKVSSSEGDQLAGVHRPALHPVRIERREHRLLAHDSAYRALRTVGLGLGIFLLVGELIVKPLSRSHGELPAPDYHFPLGAIIVLFALGVVAHVKVLHAESVRFHLERRRFGLCPKCGYDLEGNVDSGCPECGWRRAK